MNKLTKAQRNWLQHLSDHGPTARGKTNVGFTCMMQGWTEWYVRYSDGRIERLRGQEASASDQWLDGITDKGRSALTSNQEGNDEA